MSSKVVPLVEYQNDERRVTGSCVVGSDGFVVVDFVSDSKAGYKKGQSAMFLFPLEDAGYLIEGIDDLEIPDLVFVKFANPPEPPKE